MVPAFHSLWASLTRPLKRGRVTTTARNKPGEAEEAPVRPSIRKMTLSREELAALAVETITAIGARGPVDHERVMGALMPRVGGRSTGAEVSAIVTELLAHQDDPSR